MNLKTSLVEGIPTARIQHPSDIEGMELIDVRGPDEFTGELGHIKGSVLKTLGPELENYLQIADKKKSILFICRSGARSARATAYALQLGFNEVYNMEGGMLNWNANGFEVTYKD